MHLILNFKIFYKAVSAHRAHSRLQGDPSTLCTPPHIPSWPTKRVPVFHNPGNCWNSSTTDQSHVGNAALSLPTEKHGASIAFIKIPRARQCFPPTQKGSWLAYSLQPTCIVLLRRSERGPVGPGQQKAPVLTQGSEGIPQAPSIPGAPCTDKECQGLPPDHAQPEALE